MTGGVVSNTPDIDERSRQQRYRNLLNNAKGVHARAIDQTQRMSEQLQHIPTDDLELLPVDREQQHRWARLADEADSIAGGWSETARRYNLIAEDIRKTLDARDTVAWEEEQEALGNIPPRTGRRREG
jgi:hypothetical protein